MWREGETSVKAGVRPSHLKGVSNLRIHLVCYFLRNVSSKAGFVVDAWSMRQVILSGRKGVDNVICNKNEACFTSRGWSEVVVGNGVTQTKG